MSTRRQWIKSVGACAVATALPARLWALEANVAAKGTWPLGVCTSVKNAEKMRGFGAEYIEDSVGSLLMPTRPDAEFAEILAAVKRSPIPVLACNGFLPRELKCTGPEAVHDAVLEYAKIAFGRAQQVGVGTIVFGSSRARRPPGNWPVESSDKQMVELLSRMAPLAQACGVTVCIEPLNTGETDYINRVMEGVAMVKRVNHPHIQTMADIFHMLRNGEEAEDIRRAAGHVRHVHVAEKAQRSAPGVEGDDFTAYFRALKDIGYTGPVSIEGRFKDEQLPRGFEVLREQIAAATA